MHRKLEILAKTGYAVLGDYRGPAISPAEWERLEYLDWKSGGDTNFAPIATADGELDCRGFWSAGDERPDKGARFTSNALRIEHRTELISLLQKHFDSAPRDTWLTKFAVGGIPAAPINGVPEALRDEQALARGMIVQMEHPALREVRTIANPVKFSDTPVSYRLPPPMLGEHTKEIMRNLGTDS